MAHYFTVSTRKEFNIRLGSRAAEDRQYRYVQTTKKARRTVPAEEGEPPGENDGRKNHHLNWVKQWWEYEEEVAEKEGRPPNYSLVYEPPAAGSGQEEQANGAKLLVFYRSILKRFDGHDEPLLAVNTELEKCMIGFFGDMLAAQFDGCPKRLQDYALLSAADKDAIKALARRIDTKVRERIRDRDPYSETLGAALTEQEVLRYLNLTRKEMKGYNWCNVMSLKAIIAHMFLNANRAVREIRLKLKNVVDEELETTAKSDLLGVSTEHLLVHGFTVQAGGPGAQDKIRGKTASRWVLPKRLPSGRSGRGVRPTAVCVGASTAGGDTGLPFSREGLVGYSRLAGYCSAAWLLSFRLDRCVPMAPARLHAGIHRRRAAGLNADDDATP
ncbi:g8567 [Coccomyxa elongata]